MSSLNTLTGRNGHIKVDASEVARCTQWAVSPKNVGTSEWGDSDSDGYTNRAAGRRDATFTCEGKYDTTDEVFDLFQPEDIVEAYLYMNAATLYWYFPRALCIDFNLTVDIDSEAVVGWTASFGADGIFYKPGDAP